MSRAQPVVAIDGPAGTGKSTVAQAVARRLGYTLVDTGAIYRCVALAADRCGVDESDGLALGSLADGLVLRFEPGATGNRVWLDGEEVTEAIRTPQVSQGASKVSAHPQVRQALLERQREMGQEGGVVLEGRDIGTVVFPDAEVKVFLTADPEVRAQRRHAELAAKGQQMDLAQTLAEVQERDARDQGRKVAPLKPADDAVLIDSGPMTVAQVVDAVVDLVRARAAISLSPAGDDLP